MGKKKQRKEWKPIGWKLQDFDFSNAVLDDLGTVMNKTDVTKAYFKNGVFVFTDGHYRYK